MNKYERRSKNSYKAIIRKPKIMIQPLMVNSQSDSRDCFMITSM